jgi:hypothetical protein
VTTDRPTGERWDIPRRVWLILASWGLAVLLLAGLLSFWIWSNDRQASREAAEIQREQDRAMCVMIGLFLSGPEPVPGPAGDRARDVVAAMRTYHGTLHCDELR